MKKIITTAAVALTFNLQLFTISSPSGRSGGACFAQQIPMYSLYYNNLFLYNPSLAGAGCGNAFILNRNQWGTNMPDAPKTRAFTLDGPIKGEKIGLGLKVVNDVAGMFNTMSANVAYSYMVKINDKQNLRFGVSGGVFDQRIDFTKAVAKDQSDAGLYTSAQRQLAFDGGFGLNYKLNKLQIGFALPHIIGNKIKYFDNKTSVYYTLARQYMISAKYDLNVSENFKLTPLVFVRVSPAAPVQYDVNLVGTYKNKFWLGAMYRSAYGVSFSGGIKLMDQWSLGYAYDWAAIGTASGYVGGTHEIMLGYTFCKKDKKDNADLEPRVKALEDKVAVNTADIDTLKNKANNHESRIAKNEKDIDSLKRSFNDFKHMMNETMDAVVSNQTKNTKAIKDINALKNVKEVAVGDVFEFNNINYAFDSSAVALTSHRELNELAEIMKKNPTMEIQVAGNADETGTEEYNMALSQARATGIRGYLIAKGIAPNRVTTKAYGEERPMDGTVGVHNKEERRLNRRAEFKIIKK